ncbi:MAG TPA: hypothetical protein VH856_05660 [Steroidobacteraceae bacterium]|jgi:hypothetical protein
MSYQLAISEKPGYLHFTVTGPNTVENVRGYLQDVFREAEVRNCASILIEERLTGKRLETWDVYQIAAAGGSQLAGRMNAVAYVDVNAHGDLMKFAETVLNNRGLPMNVFATVAEAEAWLAGRTRP